MIWQKQLLDWYEVYKRDFPWRETKDPYHIWLSEIIMQQTRTQQGLPYYKAFVETYPTVHDLAAAPEEAVLKLWQGLGYYSRARNLHSTAQYISRELGGLFPSDFETLKTLKGVGDYTASAIASIAFGVKQAVVDGNVYRVYARFFGIDVPINSAPAFKHFKAIAQNALPASDPGTFNQAVMELGALQCSPQQPKCSICPLQRDCNAYALQQVAHLPVKEKRSKIKKRFFHYLVFDCGDEKKYLQQRTAKGIWYKLYEFPLVEANHTLKKPNQKFNEVIQRFTKDPFVVRQMAPPQLHKLSHQHIEISFWEVKLTDIRIDGYDWEQWYQLPVPVPIANFLKENETSKNSYI
ncbi:MAG: A/G-specific adenine glycosylase [Flavobacteriales bacterium]|jgi:A/G-specific adenine glycosylase|nr:A/G-specific adenine glycosylase [Flavobacteriales bacterium]